MIYIFWYSAIVDLTFGDFYFDFYFYTENWSFLSLIP